MEKEGKRGIKFNRRKNAPNGKYSIEIYASRGDYIRNTIKGGCRRAEKSCKVLMMMMKAAKMAGSGAGLEHGRSKARAGLKHEQSRSRAGIGQEQSIAE